MSTLIRIEASQTYPFPREKLWPILSRTDWFNRAVGLPPVEYVVTALKQGGSEVEGRTRFMGLEWRWRELPFEWLEGEFYRVRRIFQTGPFAEGSMGMEFRALGDGGTKVIVTSEFTPNGSWGATLARGLLTRRIRKAAQGALDHVAEHLQGQKLIPLPRLSASAPNESVLQAGLAQLRDTGQAESLISTLEGFLRNAPDVELTHIRPWAVARAWGVDRWDLLHFFLRATRAGLLDFRWEVLCPNCRSTRLPPVRSLSELQHQSHCEVCQIRFDAEFDRSVELKFMVNPAVRPVESQTYCLAGPGGRPHVVSQLFLEPGQRRVWRMPPLDRPFRLRSPQVKAPVLLTPDESPTPVFQTVVICRPEQFEVKYEFGRGGESSAQFFNSNDFPVVLNLEDPHWSPDILTAAQVANWQEFRDLFSTEVIAPDEQITVGAQVLLFTDLRGSTALYNGLGDAPAYVLVRNHFRVLFDAVREHHGAVVKTIGDAVMAAFSSLEDALAAVARMHENLDQANPSGALASRLALKSALHVGPCLAVNANEKLDYFGATVNLAARIVECCEGGELAVSQAVWQRAETVEFMKAPERSAKPCEVKFRGFDLPVPVHRITMRGS